MTSTTSYEAGPVGVEPSEVQSRPKKKSRLGNWTEQEMHWLAVAKRMEWEIWKAKHPRGNMVADKETWEKIVQFLVSKGVCGRDGPSCLCKWNLLLKLYRQIKDHQLHSAGTQDYWKLSSEERVATGLPKYFLKDLYDDMDFLSERACNQPKSTANSMAVVPSVEEVLIEEELLSGDSCMETPQERREPEETPLPPRGPPPTPASRERFTNTSPAPFPKSTGKKKKSTSSTDLINAFKSASEGMAKILGAESAAARFEKALQHQEGVFAYQQKHEDNMFRFELQKAENELNVETANAVDCRVLIGHFGKLVEHFGKLANKRTDKGSGSQMNDREED